MKYIYILLIAIIAINYTHLFCQNTLMDDIQRYNDQLKAERMANSQALLPVLHKIDERNKNIKEYQANIDALGLTPDPNYDGSYAVDTAIEVAINKAKREQIISYLISRYGASRDILVTKSTIELESMEVKYIFRERKTYTVNIAMKYLDDIESIEKVKSSTSYSDLNRNAIKCYIEAANKGEEKAQYYLGDCYYSGIGVIQNYEEAYFWLLIASVSGNKDTVDLRDKIAIELTSQQKTSIQERASKWLIDKNK